MSVPPGVICTAQEYQQSLKDTSIGCLDRFDTLGVMTGVQASLLSLAAIVYVFVVIGQNVMWRIKHMPTARLRVFHQPMDILIFSLLLCDIVQAIGTTLTLKWIQYGKVEVGTYCTVQGTIKVFGATGVALSTLTIAIYTFVGVWMMKGIKSMRITLGVVLSIWLSIGVLVTVGHLTNSDPSKPKFMSPTPYWCFVNGHYLEWRLLGEYLWMWLALFSSCLIYIPLYLWMRMDIIVDDSAWCFKRSKDIDPYLRAKRKQSLVMLVYPLVYCITIMPLSVVRWISFIDEKQHHLNNMPAAATFAAESIFALSGFFNVILLLTTRPESGLFGQLMFVSPARLPSGGSDFRNQRRGATSRVVSNEP